MTASSETINNPVSTPAPYEIQVANRVYPSRYFLAPLAGYTQLAFRRALRELGGLGLATTDLVLAKSIIAEGRKAMDLTATTPDDKPLSVQIYGGDTTDLVRAAKWLEDHGYTGIDLNMGCPMAKITGNGGGARLMCDTDNACGMVSSVVNAVKVPVSVKMRLGWGMDDLTAPALSREFEQLGVTAITIHGRTRQQGYHGTVNHEGIAATVAAVDRIPVVGNGDVLTVEDAFAMREKTGCDAVAIGRGALLDPWIFEKIDAAVHGREFCEPTPEKLIDFMVRHFFLMVEQHNDYACIMIRKFVGWYGAHLGIPEDLERQLRMFESIEEFEQLVEQIRVRHGEGEKRVPTALLKIPNGPIAHW